MRRLVALMSLTAAGCVGAPPNAPLEAEITTLVHTSDHAGSFTLALFLPGDASSSTEVWLEALTVNGLLGSSIAVETEVAFPLTIEPGELHRVFVRYQLSQGSCLHSVGAELYDAWSEDVIAVPPRSAAAPGCNSSNF